MAVGGIGRIGKRVPYLVEVLTKAELVHVTVLLPNSAVMIALVILLEPKDAMKILAQVS